MSTAPAPSGRADTAEIVGLLARLAELLTPPPAPVVVERRPFPSRTLLTVEEAAEWLGIGRTRVFALVKSGDIESVRIGRLRRISIDALTAYTARLAVPSGSELPTNESEMNDAA